MRISDWSSDVCSSDLQLVSMQHFGDDNFLGGPFLPGQVQIEECALPRLDLWPSGHELGGASTFDVRPNSFPPFRSESVEECGVRTALPFSNYCIEQRQAPRSEEHTSELTSLMRISYAVFCLKQQHTTHQK